MENQEENGCSNFSGNLARKMINSLLSHGKFTDCLPAPKRSKYWPIKGKNLFTFILLYVNMYLVNVGTFTDFIQNCFGFCFFIRKFYHFQL